MGTKTGVVIPFYLLYCHPTIRRSSKCHSGICVSECIVCGEGGVGGTKRERSKERERVQRDTQKI